MMTHKRQGNVFMNWKKLIKAIAFVLIFAFVFSYVSVVVTAPADYRNYQWIGGFYEEPEDSLDAVYIGSSTCYSSWNSMAAWQKYGIAVYPYSCNAQHIITTEYLLKEVRKTQPDSLYIVNVNTIYDDKMVTEEFHHLLDYMPMSLNKLELIRYLSETAGLTFEESLELYVPLYRYHSRWSSLKWDDFSYELDGMKGASYYDLYIRNITDISKSYEVTDEREPLPGYIEEAVISLLEYCKKENLNMLFITVPRVEDHAKYLRQINYLNDLIASYGFPTLDLMDDVEAIGLNLHKDYYNKGHLNIHGSVKYTQYLSEYLIREYGFEDKRGNPAYESWDAGLGKYIPHLDERVLDIEKDVAFRTDALAEPADLTLTPVKKEGIRVEWKPVEGADGYVVYHKLAGKTWSAMTTVTETSCVDTEVSKGKRYYYTVVPYCDVDGVRYYGDFSYNGLVATAK